MSAMTHGSVDRRAARTIAKLQHAHLTLIHERGYDRTSVEDICDAAGVSRSGFYAHFSGKDDLKRSGLRDLERQLLALQKSAGAEARFSFSLPLFEHARDHLNLYRALAGTRGGVVALGAIRSMLRRLIAREAAAVAPSLAASERKIAVEFLSGAYLALLVWWLDDNARLSPSDLDAQFRTLALAGLAPR